MVVKASVPASLESCIEESIHEIDDRQVLALRNHPICGPAAREEFYRRKQYEAAESGDLPLSRGPLATQSCMDGMSSVTLEGIARGRAGEPDHVISMAQYVLKSRKAKPPTSDSYPPSVRTDHEKEIFDRLSHQIATGHPKDARAAADILFNKFGCRT